MGKFILHIGLQLDTSSLDKEEGGGGGGGQRPLPTPHVPPAPSNGELGLGLPQQCGAGRGWGRDAGDVG